LAGSVLSAVRRSVHSSRRVIESADVTLPSPALRCIENTRNSVVVGYPGRRTLNTITLRGPLVEIAEKLPTVTFAGFQNAAMPSPPPASKYWPAH